MQERSTVHLRTLLPTVNTGYSYSSSSSYHSSAFEKEQQIAPALRFPIMSRRSLRLHTAAPYGEDGLLDRSLPYCSSSFSVGGPGLRDSKLFKSRRSQQHSVSCSQSLLHHHHHQTPHKQSSQSLHNSSLHSVASDASLLSSMLDESSIQERTVVDSFWGLDHDADPKESTILSEHSHALANSTLITNGDDHCPNHPAQTQTSAFNGYHCKDCALHSERKEALTTYASPKYNSPSSSSPGAGGPVHSGAADQGLAASKASSPPPTIYCRDKNRKSKTGLLASTRDTVLSASRRSASSAAYFLSLLCHHVLLRKLQDGPGVLRSLLTSSLLYGRGAAASTVSILTLALQASQRLVTRASQAAWLSSWIGWGKAQADASNGKSVNGAHARYCRDMNIEESGTKGKQLNHNGSLRSYLFWLAQRAGSAGWAASKKLLSSSSTGQSPGKTSSNVLQWLRKGWHHTVTFMSPLAGFFMTRCLPKLLPFVLIILPLILLSSLFWPWGPSDLLPTLPAVNVTDWWSALPLSILPGLSSIFDSTSTRSQSMEDPAEESRDLQAYVEPPYNAPPPAEEEPPFIPPLPTEAQEEEEEEASSVDSTRLLRLEQSLSRLWEHVEGGGRRAEQRHEDVLQMYQGLRRQLHSETPGENAEPWVAGQLEERLADLTAQLEEERAQREQTQKQYLVQQENQASRLAELELLLQSLLAKTEEMQEIQEAATTAVPSTTVPAPVSVGVDRESHDALLAEVARLEEALGSVRQDLQGLTGYQDGCDRLDDMQGTVSAEVSAQVSAQVREELRAVFYGNQLATVSSDAPGDPTALPDSLLQWLTDRYVSGSDLQASLASLELGILRNVSLRLEQQGQGKALRGEDVTRTIVHSMGAAGAAVTEEQVQQIVRNALRFYSQDRTGLADYALESGGGSILSTRCSETYGTRTALLSLFGLPLWYFSQSPRVVIQPDVHPGNCWAFKGSNGYLVIRLSMKVIPTAFSLEHMPKALSPSGTLLSAPRDFAVYGLDDDSQENGKLLGSYTYEQDGEALQTYPVSEENDSDYQIIEVRVLSNWGHQEYTCMYRFRVHGTPSDD